MTQSRFATEIDLRVGDMLLRGKKELPSTVIARWCSGSATPGHLIWACVFFPIFSKALLAALSNEKLTGFESHPISLIGKSGERIRDYFGIQVTGRCGPADLRDSSVIVREYPGGWFPEFEGYYFAPESWDGSDLFMELPDSKGNE